MVAIGIEYRSGPSIITWTDFERTFYNAYSPHSYKDAKKEEFLKIGEITIPEYQAKSIQISKYAQVLIIMKFINIDGLKIG